MDKFKVGDYIISDNDGEKHLIVKFGPRDELDPLPGVKQIGNCAIVADSKNALHMLFEWEMTPVQQASQDDTNIS